MQNDLEFIWLGRSLGADDDVSKTNMLIYLPPPRTAALTPARAP